jgi:hypothetical protein
MRALPVLPIDALWPVEFGTATQYGIGPAHGGSKSTTSSIVP